MPRGEQRRRKGEPTRSYLLRVLRRQVGASDWIIWNAEEGLYDEVTSDLADPISQLVRDLHRDGFGNGSDIVKRVRAGEFDSTADEWAEWADSEEGQRVLAEVFGKSAHG